MCAATNAGGAGPRHLWVVGHRGSPTHEPENTLASFERALDDGANALEMDLCVTGDAEVVVWHDFDPLTWRARFRRLGLEPFMRYRPSTPAERRFRRPTSELSLAELRAHYGYAQKPLGRRVRAEIPTLDELVTWAAKQERLGLVFFDVKVPGEREDLLSVLVRRVEELVARHAAPFRVVFESGSSLTAAALARLAPRHAHALDVEPRPGIVLDGERYSAARAAIRHGLTHATPLRPRGITLFPFQTHRRIVTEDLAVMRRHNASSPAKPLEGVASLVINRRREMRALIELGVWAMQTDRPALLRDVAHACGRTTSRTP